MNATTRTKKGPPHCRVRAALKAVGGNKPGELWTLPAQSAKQVLGQYSAHSA